MANRKAVPTTDTSSRSAITRYFCSTVMVIASLPNTLHQLVLKHPELAGFNGIFWCEYSALTLTPISLMERRVDE